MSLHILVTMKKPLSYKIFYALSHLHFTLNVKTKITEIQYYDDVNLESAAFTSSGRDKRILKYYFARYHV